MEEIEQRIVNNRDIPVLQRVYGIMQDIVSLEERREWQRDRLTNISQHLSGMPGGGGVPKGMDDAFARISELEDRHKGLCRQYRSRLLAAEKILNGIESESMRTFVRLMYLDNIPSSEVRERLNMTRRGFDRARSAVENANSMDTVVWHERYILTKKVLENDPKVLK